MKVSKTKKQILFIYSQLTGVKHPGDLKDLQRLLDQAAFQGEDQLVGAADNLTVY